MFHPLSLAAVPLQAEWQKYQPRLIFGNREDIQQYGYELVHTGTAVACSMLVHQHNENINKQCIQKYFNWHPLP